MKNRKGVIKEKDKNPKIYKDSVDIVESHDGKLEYIYPDYEFRNDRGEYHCEDGPAVIWANGDKFWYKNGLRHRLDGPAIIYSNGDIYWYINGVKISDEEINIRNRKAKLEKILFF